MKYERTWHLKTKEIFDCENVIYEIPALIEKLLLWIMDKSGLDL